MDPSFKKEKKLLIIFIITILFIITNLVVIYFVLRGPEEKMTRDPSIINDIPIKEKEVLEIEDEKIDIDFEYSEDWILLESGKTDVGTLVYPSGGNVVLLYSFDGQGIIMITKTETLEDNFDLDNVQKEFLDIFADDPRYNLISNIMGEIDSLKAKDAVFTYQDQEEIVKVRQVITDELNNYYYNFIFLTNRKDYERFLTDFNLILETVKFF